ncbi:MAG: hypothetical protein N3A38_03745 [Planctomycetota bacterium]|nr:hypothetical protein [Planctomycetota bacterium]
MPLTNRENYLRNVTMSGPEWIPYEMHISGASWNQYRGEMEEVCVRHPLIFPGFERGKQKYEDHEFDPGNEPRRRITDAWGCEWEFAVGGLEGVVVKHPLADWSALASYKAPDPEITEDRGPVNWGDRRRRVEEARAKGKLTTGNLPHGFLVMRMQYLRGFENSMVDFATEDENLQHLIDIVNEHNLKQVEKWISFGVDVLRAGEDLGTQTRPIMRPETFRKWIVPAYKKLFIPCRKAGIHVDLHSDGRVLELIDCFLESGVDIVNPQDLVNGIDNLAREVKGRCCIRLDVDRQKIIPFGTAREIRELVEEEVRKLGSPAGGLSFIAGIYPPTTPANVDALCRAFEEFRTFWWDGRAREKAAGTGRAGAGAERREVIGGAAETAGKPDGAEPEAQGKAGSKEAKRAGGLKPGKRGGSARRRR